MSRFLRERDLRQLFVGAPAVVIAGLIAGGFAHPQLRGPDELGGPQLQAGVAGARSERTYDLAAGWASYSGQVPDYVIGTDWLKPPSYDEIDASIDAIDHAPVMAYAAEEHAADAYEPAAQPETNLVAVSYPSTEGGRPYEADLPPPPEPPMDEAPAAG
jgi:hypothetical protein